MLTVFRSAHNENKKAYNTAVGTLYVYTGDLLQYSKDYWPTVDSFRLPGTTVEAGVTTPASAYAGDGSGTSYSNFVGGVDSWSRTLGAAGIDLWPNGSTLRGKKAWFFLDDEIICLGAGLTASGGKTIETVVENRRLDGSNAFTVAGAAALGTTSNTATTLSAVQSAHLVDNSGGTGIGYYFPSATTLKGYRQSRTAAWYDINTDRSPTQYPEVDDPKTQRYLTLWIDHGINPAAGSYSYAVLPAVSSATLATYVSAPEYTVLSNSTSVQAIKENTIGIVMGLFWSPNTSVGSGLDRITVNSRSAVTVRKEATTLDVTVADPTRRNTGSITVTLDRTAASVSSKDSTVTVQSLSPTIVLVVNMNGTKGATQRVRLNL